MTYEEYKTRMFTLPKGDPQRKTMAEQYPEFAARFTAQSMAALAKVRELIAQRTKNTHTDKV